MHWVSGAPVQHAQYMAKVFNEAGIPSAAVSGNSSTEEREGALSKLRARELNCIFAVDLFNEGLDVPGDRHDSFATSYTELDGVPATTRPRTSAS